jgi:hypothetical protein
MPIWNNCFPGFLAVASRGEAGASLTMVLPSWSLGTKSKNNLEPLPKGMSFAPLTRTFTPGGERGKKTENS